MRSFKKLCKPVLLFLLIISMVSALFSCFYLCTEYFYYQDAKERGDLTGTLDTLYCGASLALRAFRPDRIDPVLGTNGYNLSGSRMTMLGRYTLLQKEIRRNPVKTVVLEVSSDTLVRDSAEEGPEGELITFARLSAKERCAYFSKAFRPADWPLLYYDLVSRGIDDCWSLCRGNLCFSNWALTRGHYPYHESDKPFSTDYQALLHTQKLPTETKDENIEYLDQILALCRKQGAELVLVTVPQSKAFNCSYANLDVFHDWYADYANRNGLRYYNFNLYRGITARLPDEGNFYDRFHLNNSGSETFSEMYASVMARTAAGEALEGEFYESYAQMTADPDYLEN